MSVKELSFGNFQIEIKNEATKIFKLKLVLDRHTIYREMSQAEAHLLYLYLQEHLK